MLRFFRNNQRVFFLFTTVIIVISFSFFGTYGTNTGATVSDNVVFQAVDGSEVYRSELDAMELFLSTDIDDKREVGGAWGYNFLNDGVIRKDLLESGIGEMLAQSYMTELRDDIQSRLDKEKNYRPYVHPGLNALAATTIWQHFAPEIRENLDRLQTFPEAENKDTFAARVDLYLAEKAFPQSSLKQMVRFQEKQYNWIQPDADLFRRDLSLFGYHSLQDWFGPRFVRLMTQFIINSSIIAEEKGYVVTEDEALVDLVRHTQVSYQENKDNPHLGISSSKEYFQEHLRRMNITESKAVKMWQRVMLFRRLFDDVGSNVLIDAYTFQKFNSFSDETVEVDLYQLPQELRLEHFDGLQRFETYTRAVAPRPANATDKLSLPGSFLSPEEVERDFPELVQRRYLLKVSEVNKGALEVRVGLKDTWDWELDEANWSTLVSEFPVLADKAATTSDQRFRVLETLDDGVRFKVDAFARKRIVDLHPEWLADELEKAETKQMVLGLRKKGGTLPFKGDVDRKELSELLEAVTHSGGSGQGDAALKAAEKLSRYSADGENVYSIVVLDRSAKKDILTFAEASADHTLNKIVDKQLNEHYKDIRRGRSKEFRGDNGEWKPLHEVRNIVAESFYQDTIEAIHEDTIKLIGKENAPEKAVGRLVAPYRLFFFVRSIQEIIASGGKKDDFLKGAEPQSTGQGTLAPRQSLRDQWKLEKTVYTASRSMRHMFSDDNVFNMVLKEWSSTEVSRAGSVYFFQVLSKLNNDTKVAKKIDEAKALLSAEAREMLANSILETLKEKKAISFGAEPSLEEGPSSEEPVKNTTVEQNS